MVLRAPPACDGAYKDTTAIRIFKLSVHFFNWFSVFKDCGLGWLMCVVWLLYLVEVGLFEWLYAVLVDGDFEAGAGVAAGAYEVGLCGVGVDCVGELYL